MVFTCIRTRGAAATGARDRSIAAHTTQASRGKRNRQRFEKKLEHINKSIRSTTTTVVNAARQDAPAAVQGAELCVGPPWRQRGQPAGGA